MKASPELHILLIEDDDMFCHAIGSLLKHKAPFKFVLERAHDVSKGIELLSNKPFDVILCDLTLPDSSGIETFRRIHRMTPLHPLIIMTGNDDESVAIQALQEGAQDYLEKGELDGRSLSRAIRYAIERSRLIQQRDDFMATLVHDVKNPLISTDRLYQYILEKHFGEIDPRLQEVTNVLKRSNESVMQLLMNLLEIYRYDVNAPQFQYEDLDLGCLVQKSTHDLIPLAALKNLELESAILDESIKVRGDMVAIKRVLFNIIGNSIKFTQDGGKVKVGVRIDDGSALITVEDNGMGISDIAQKYLFQRFYQTGKVKDFPLGTGLGLYVCRQIIEAHSGLIHCESKSGKGTTFTIQLPRALAEVS
ncbi:MAG: hybrid sensor histidine kinase/response regulator [Cyanobacteria bacterium TGS_CYA1]|nr:hybrid sensor histidine kinase/response regulator [Cyanobacteria bacterium TGS_CYA1]